MLPEPAALDIDCRNLVLKPLTAVPAQQRRGRHDETVPTPGRKETSQRSDEGTIRWAQPWTRLLARQHCQLVTEQDEFDVFGELGTPTSNEQPQNSRECKVSEREEHREMLPARGTALTADCFLRRSAVSGTRARASTNKRPKEPRGDPPGNAELTFSGLRCRSGAAQNHAPTLSRSFDTLHGCSTVAPSACRALMA